MKKHLIHVVVVLAVLILAGLSQAAQLKTKEDVLAHLIANSPWRGTWVWHGPRGIANGGMTAIFRKEGGYLYFTHTARPVDGDIKNLEILLEGDKVTLTFINSNIDSLARYKLELKDDKLVGIAERIGAVSDIELAPHPTK